MYQLKKGVYLVRGALNGAILDTLSGNVYSINAQACQVLSGEIPDDSYWEMLLGIGLAENIKTLTVQILPKAPASTAVDFVWFEVVTDNCNERCVHCYANAMPDAKRKAQVECPILRKKLTHTDWLRLIQEVYDLGCRKCQFIGGEPFLYMGPNKETVLDLAEYSVKMGYEFVEIYTNATLLTLKKVKRIKELGIKVAVSLYSTDSNVHDAITQTPGSHAKTMNAIKLLQQYEVPTRVEIVLMKPNQDTILETLSWRDSQNLGGKTPDPLRPNGRGNNPSLQPDMNLTITYGVMTTPNFCVDEQTLAHYTSANSCLHGKLTITEFGDVLPCVFSRTQILGNVLKGSNLTEIVHGEPTRKVWNSTKDQVMVCKDCEFRYVCVDCRPLADGASLGRASFLEAPSPRCSYNPYTGIWGEGLWMVDETGKPVYDETCKDVLQANIHGAKNDITTAKTH